MRLLFLIILGQIAFSSLMAQSDTSLTESIEWLNRFPSEYDRRELFYDFTDEVKFNFELMEADDTFNIKWNNSYFDNSYSKWVSDNKTFQANDILIINLRPYVKNLFEVSIDYRDPSRSNGYNSVDFIFNNEVAAKETFNYFKVFAHWLNINCQFSNQLEL